MSLTQKDFQSAAALLGVPVAAVKAVAEVEANGSGFLPDGRPKILFERHIFVRQLVAKGISTSKLPSDIASTKPGGYATGSTATARGMGEHERLERASKIDRDAALESCSWGAFQIMGFHWKALGYPTLQAFVNAMYKDDANQLDAFVRFIKADSRLVRAMKAQDWAVFAKIYNGPNYAINKYDTKLATAFKNAGEA